MIVTSALLLTAAASVQEAEQQPVRERGRPAVVAEGGATVRAFHKETVAAVAELAEGTPLRVVEVREPWARVLVPGGLRVWVHGDYVDRTGSGMGELNGAHVRVRPLPSTGPESYPLGQFAEGAEVVLLDARGDWLQVIAPETIGGWLKQAEIAEQGAGASPAEVWDAAGQARREALIAGARARVHASAERHGVGPPVRDDPAASAERSAPDERVDVAFPAALAGLQALLALPPAEVDPARLESVTAGIGAALLWSGDPERVRTAHQALGQLDRLQAAVARERAWRAQQEAAERARREREAEEQEEREAEAARRAAEEEQRERERNEAARQAAIAAREAEILANNPRETVTGKLERRRREPEGLRFVLVDGARVVAVHSFDGAHELEDYLGSKITVDGVWRASAVAGRKVLGVLTVSTPQPDGDRDDADRTA